MERRKFIIGLGALASGSAAAVGTGAFTTAEVERDVVFLSADDHDALLALREGSENGHYVTEDSDNSDHIELRFDDHNEEVDGTGIQNDSHYTFDRILEIVNQGGNDVGVWVVDEGGATSTSYYWENDPEDSAEGSENARNLESGGSIEVGVEMDMWEVGNEDGSFSVHGDANEFEE